MNATDYAPQAYDALQIAEESELMDASQKAWIIEAARTLLADPTPENAETLELRLEAVQRSF